LVELQTGFLKIQSDLREELPNFSFRISNQRMPAKMDNLCVWPCFGDEPKVEHVFWEFFHEVRLGTKTMLNGFQILFFAIEEGLLFAAALICADEIPIPI